MRCRGQYETAGFHCGLVICRRLNDLTGSDANAFPRQVLSRIMFILQPIMPHLAEEVLSRTHKQIGGVAASNVTWDDEVRPNFSSSDPETYRPLGAIMEE